LWYGTYAVLNQEALEAANTSFNQGEKLLFITVDDSSIETNIYPASIIDSLKLLVIIVDNGIQNSKTRKKKKKKRKTEQHQFPHPLHHASMPSYRKPNHRSHLKEFDAHVSFENSGEI
jgi:hypothetical protein